MNDELIGEVKKAIIGKEPYPGYPSDRYVAPVASDEILTIPDGPWNMNNTNLPTVEQSLKFMDAGYQVDALGRPLHPHFAAMVSDPEVGVVGGRGRYYNWGPNYTADPIVITKTAQPRVLLIQRGDDVTGKTWAVPGGFVDPEDTDAAMAAKRELKEEASFDSELEAKEVYVGVVGDRRTTAHAWAETSAYLLQPDRQSLVTGGDDATDAVWLRLDKLDERLFGSHNFLIKESLALAEFEHKRPIAEIMALPQELRSIKIIDAGHMAYDHEYVSDGESTLFAKVHVAARFTDAFREMHSREYLKKEDFFFEYVAQRGYRYIPDRVELIESPEGLTLAMDALRSEDGYSFEAPDDPKKFAKYVPDVLEAFDHLQRVKIPESPEYRKSINATFETFFTEGWDDITDEKVDTIVKKIRSLSAGWNGAQRQLAEDLIADLPALREYSAGLNRTPELFMAHNDTRPSNIGWREDDQAYLIDWSWGDPAPKDADATMFLIDLVKSGRDVTPYFDYINKDQAILLIGFWLAHSLWNTRDGSTTVREQQVASASAAHRLLKLLP